MNLSLKGKRAIVCGSTQGIGKAIALMLSKQKAHITLVSRDETKLKNVLKELDDSDNQEHNFIVADFNDPDKLKTHISAFLSKGYNAEILINNTGGPPAGQIMNAKKEEFDKYISMHLHCSHILVKAFVPHMKKLKFGRIVNIISVSVKAPIQNLGVSNTVRWAMASWSKTLSFELGKFGITINNILPGFTLTERLKDLINETKFDIVGNCTASFGVAEFRRNHSKTKFVSNADNALYKAKDDGRNRVVMYESLDY